MHGMAVARPLKRLDASSHRVEFTVQLLPPSPVRPLFGRQCRLRERRVSSDVSEQETAQETESCEGQTTTTLTPKAPMPVVCEIPTPLPFSLADHLTIWPVTSQSNTAREPTCSFSSHASRCQSWSLLTVGAPQSSASALAFCRPPSFVAMWPARGKVNESSATSTHQRKAKCHQSCGRSKAHRSAA